MDNLLPFRTRDVYNREKFQQWEDASDSTAHVIPRADQPLTPLEIYSKLRMETLESLKKLVAFYQATGQWGDGVDMLLGRVLVQLDAICMQLAQYEPLGPLGPLPLTDTPA